MMFNTGDIVRWNDHGSLETFGRKDDQVKIKVCIKGYMRNIADFDRASVLSWTELLLSLRYFYSPTLYLL